MEAATKKIIDTDTLDPNFKYEIANQPGGEMIMRCFACGTCSASCPVREIDDRYNPRKIVRMALLGMREKVLTSDFIWLCANCHTCYERCPQDVRFTDIIHAIRNIALKEEKSGKIKIKEPNILFIRQFLNSIRRYGRIWELDMIGRFFLQKLDFKGMISYMPLGIKMFMKGKLLLKPHFNLSAARSAKKIFKKVKEVEK